MRKDRIAEILRFVLPDMALEIETGCDGSEAPLGPTIDVVVASQQDLVRREAILRTSAYDTVYTKKTKIVLSSGGDAITEDLLASRVLDHDWQFPFGAVSWTSDWSFMVEQAFRQDPFPFLEPILQMMAAFQEHPATDVDATQLTFVEHRMKTENLFITMAFFTSAPQPYPGAGGRCWMLVLPDAPPSLVSAIAIP
ncbi:hypothetical protein BGX23_002349, partial [Mortierella sp. AD031]